MKLYTFFRSSAAYRTRIALNLKNINTEMTSVKFANGENRGEAYRSVNPQMRVPSLLLDEGAILIQSDAIIEYLDEIQPQPPFLPRDPIERAKVRAVAQIIACDIHPLNNIGPLNYLRKTLGQSEDAVNAWYRHWVVEGFNAIEALLGSGPYCFGSQVTLADIFLVPQVYNARRFNVPLDKYPGIVAADAACNKLQAFEKALPENQPDAT